MAKKGLGKGLGAIFGEDVIKESEEEIAKAKAATTEKEDGKSGPEKILMRNSWLSWLIPSGDTEFYSPFWFRKRGHFMR